MQLLLGHGRVMWVDAACRPLLTQASRVHKNALRRMSPSPHGLSRDLCFIFVVLGIFLRLLLLLNVNSVGIHEFEPFRHMNLVNGNLRI